MEQSFAPLVANGSLHRRAMTDESVSSTQANLVEMKAAAKTRTPKPARRKPVVGAVVVKGHAPAFREIIGLIQSARQRAFQAVNTELIGLYWRVGGEAPSGAKSL